MIPSIRNFSTAQRSHIATKRTALMASLAAVTILLAVACGRNSASNSTATLGPAIRVEVVATTAILADLARNVGGDLIEVRAIVPPGADVHSFQTTLRDSIAVSNAQVIVSNGFGLYAFLDPVINGVRQAEAVHVVASQGLEAVPFEGGEFPSGDPHFWQNPVYAIHYVERIRDGLAQVDPGNAQVYQANAAAYIQQLRELDQDIAGLLRDVPPERRHLVTFHDAFGYFAQRYGWRVLAFVSGDASEVTPGAVVTVLERIREDGIPAVFVGPQFSPDVMEQAARDAGVRVGIIRSMVDNDVATYIDMMRLNAMSLAEHLL